MESTKFYFCPEITVVEIVPEGVLCGSVQEDIDNEPVGSNNGRW